MLNFVILLGAVACALGAALPDGMIPQLDGRIVGGDPTTISEFPWQISIQQSGSHFCGGSVIGPRLIVTAAHCLQYARPSALKVRVGSTYSNSNGTLVGVAALKIHEDYNARTIVNDIALIYLESSLNMSTTTKAIPLATTTPANGAKAVVSGWGTTSSGGSLSTQLLYVELDVVSKKECASSAYGYGNKILGNMLCAYTVGKDACQGDSGGPMVSGGVLVGIVSWGYGCAYPNYPGVYTDVSPYNTWINKTAASFEILA